MVFEIIFLPLLILIFRLSLLSLLATIWLMFIQIDWILFSLFVELSLIFSLISVFLLLLSFLFVKFDALLLFKLSFLSYLRSFLSYLQSLLLFGLPFLFGQLATSLMLFPYIAFLRLNWIFLT